MLTQVLAREITSKKRIAFGALIASLIVPITLYFPDSFINTFVGKLLYSVVIILSTFGFHSLNRIIKQLFLFYFTSFSVGGGLLAVHFLLQNPIAISSNSFLTFSSGYGDPVSWLFVAIGFPCAWIFTKSRMDKHAEGKIRYDQFYPVSVSIKGETFETTGYIDSGNHLVDPLTKKPVIICDESFLKKWFTEEDWKIFKTATETLDMEGLPEKWKNDLQLIPYQGVGGASDFLFAIKPDQILVQYEGERIITSKVLIGVQFSVLTKDQSYHCLLQPQIIKLAAVQSA